MVNKRVSSSYPHRALSCLALVIAFVSAGGAGAASAADPPIATFLGTETTTTASGAVTEEPYGYTVFCEANGCFIPPGGWVYEEVPVTYGRTTVHEVPERGDPCALGTEAYSAQTITVELSETSLSVHIETHSPVGETCPEAFSADFVGELAGGDGQPELEPVDEGILEAPTANSADPSYWIPVAGPLSWDEPSVLSGLPTTGEALTGARIATAAGGAVVLTLLMAFPSQLLSRARDRLVERGKAWWVRRRTVALDSSGEAAPQPKAPREPRRYGGWYLAVVGLLVASALAMFIDPRAGFDLGTLRLFGSVFAAFLIEVGLGWLVLIWVVGRTHPHATPWFRFKPWLLMLVVALVVFARLTGLQPGIAFGAVAAVAFAAAFTQRDQARFTLVGLAHAFVLSVVAWIGYSVMAPTVGPDAEGWLLFLHESLAGMTVAGISLLPLILIPVRGLPGHEIYGWSRIVWFVSYLVGLTAFLILLLPLPTSWSEVGLSFWAWFGLFVLYAVTAVVIWMLVLKPWKRVAVET
jgi:hypothetical protein